MAASGVKPKFATAKSVISTAASLAATVMLARSVVQDFLPHEFRQLLFLGVRNLFNGISSRFTLVIDEFDGFVSNQIYEAAETYLATKVSPSTHRLKVRKPEKEENITTAMEGSEKILDTFNGAQLHWVLVCREVERTSIHDPHSTFRSRVRSFELSFHEKNREMVLKSYLPHILKQAKHLKQETKTLKLFTADYQNIYRNLSDLWMSTNLDHPATFDKLAMEPEIKDFIQKDLERFVYRKEFYNKVGKAWKRGYLLYGPPGTGKSSLIAAMANYLKFDVYDLELAEVRRNSDLRKLLIAMSNRSILVVEDIDCTVEFQDRLKELAPHTGSRSTPFQERWVTLSGLLNFIDGLWSSCGDERIIIFTTNHREKLDPALLRPGRMDVHVHMSYCSPCGFRLLASNYLGVKDHKLFSEIEESLLTAKATPAEVAEELLKGDDCDSALKNLIEFLKAKKIENQEAEAKILQAELEAEEKEKEETEGERASKSRDGDEQK